MKSYQRRSRNGAVLLTVVLLILIAILSIALPGCGTTYHMSSFIHYDTFSGHMLVFCSSDVDGLLKDSDYIRDGDITTVEVVIVTIGDTADYILHPPEHAQACIGLPVIHAGRYSYDVLAIGSILKIDTKHEECFEILFEDIPFEIYTETP